MKLNHYSVLSSDERRVTSVAFEGGKVTSVLSELELDLRGAETPGYPAVVDMRIFLAEVDITVPEEWNIDARLSTPLCEFRDRRAIRATTEEPMGGPDLVLTGFGAIAEVTLRG